MRSEQEIHDTIRLLEAYVQRDSAKFTPDLGIGEFSSLKESICSNRRAIAYLRWALEDDLSSTTNGRNTP